MSKAVALAPWMARNSIVLGASIMVRSNVGLELRLSNSDTAVADLWATGAAARTAIRHPGGDLAEAQAVRELGEVANMRRARREAVTWTAERPGRFLRLSAARAFDFWFGP